jgi:hypothetical protein
MSPRSQGALITAVVIAVLPLLAHAQSNDAAVTLRIEVPGEPSADVQYFLSADRVRTDQGARSLVWFGGANQHVLMIRHDLRRYLDFGPAELKTLQGSADELAGRLQLDHPPVDPRNLTFRETGRFEKIGPWDAFEVEIAAPGQGAIVALWMTKGAEIGIFERPSTGR